MALVSRTTDNPMSGAVNEVQSNSVFRYSRLIAVTLYGMRLPKKGICILLEMNFHAFMLFEVMLYFYDTYFTHS